VTEVVAVWGISQGVAMAKVDMLAEMSVEELREKYGVKAEAAMVSKVRDKLYITVGKKRTLVEDTPFVPRAELEKLAGKTVTVVGTRGGSIIIIIIIGPRCYFHGCYIPAPDILRNRVISERVQRELIRGLADEKIIPEKFAQKLIGGMQ
jgi:hypothetical protein